ncbi:Dak2 dihydroxyacetone kinase [Candida orthopsilosis Co 90-125]|uniref:Dihydroxyacetone kinase n=1 Tax=Candida orthopsilosis (strain 90-125) TaxID=1136231 RepID=H8X9X8_CANO9|nr:Dak2 dihydroxyacetone kinase [Candida orthopsilosis Co 90-125]CCG24795.1 Dak2 dihydroxyacetone kinase [Candida orthopsilosis Co 90-125]
MTIAKHWKYNDNEDIVLTQLKGLIASNPFVELIVDEKVVFNPHSDTSKKITLISGGGAGHEPLHGGYVGENLLDAAVSGHIFASPSTKQIMAAIKKKSDKSKGTVIVVKNYTGDVLHFGLVAERAKSEGYKVELVAVSDDVAVGREQNKMVGRRGLAGTALVHKILGAASAEENSELKAVADLGHTVNENLVTLAASLDRTSVPGKAEQDIEFNASDEVELGLGIHNEPGTKIKPIPKLDDLIKDMLHKLLSAEDKDRHYVDFDSNDEYALLVNNIGGTSSFELYAITEHILQNLPLKKKPKRILVSDFVTSFNSPGFSITLLNLSNIDKKKIAYSSKDVLRFLDTPTNAPGWKPKLYPSEDWDDQSERFVESPMKHQSLLTSDLKVDANSFEKQLRNGLENLLKEEPKITHYDTLVGDGDCGETLAAGANSILKALKENSSFKEHLSDPIATLSRITEFVEDSMGGTSGGIYSIYLTALVQYLKSADKVDSAAVANAFYKALHDGLFKYTKARVGGRTLVDTLQPFVDTYHETKDLSKAVESARKGCEETKNLEASFGRASYVDKKEFEAEGGIPDPGAVGLLALIQGFTK